MKPILGASVLLLLFFKQSAPAPRTTHSTITVIPVPIQVTVSDNSPTATGGFRYSNLSLSYTLSYPTTSVSLTSTVYANASSSSFSSFPSLPNATLITSPLQTGVIDNATALPTEPSTYTGLPCTADELHCNSATSFSLCAPNTDGTTRYFYMGPVAAGTICKDGTIERANDGHCTPDESLSCGADGHTFFLCDEGGLINMGSVADGTTCVNGSIIASN